MNKKGVELSLNAVIIAVILLIVAAILIAIFVGKVGQVQEDLNDCKQRGGDCRLTCEDGEAAVGRLGCDAAQVCCLKVGGDSE